MHQIPENEDQQSHDEMESNVSPHAEVMEVKEVVVRATASSRRGSQSEGPRESNQEPRQSLASEVSQRYKLSSWTYRPIILFITFKN